MKDFTRLADLASERLGGSVLAANDEFFAPKENLLKTARPVFIEDKYTGRGKWMDGWETRRRREPGCDWCIIRLGLPGIVRGVVVDTSHFKGNFPEYCSLEAGAFSAPPELEDLTGAAAPWFEVLPKSRLDGDTQNLFPVQDERRFTHLRFRIYPDGGVARLRVHGEVAPDWTQLVNERGEIDLAAVAAGGRVAASSDEFFGAPQNMLLPGKALHMGDGWETRRRRGPGHDWAIIKLGIPGAVHRVEVDTAHFKGNFPESCSLEACDAESLETVAASPASPAWKEVLARRKLEADRAHIFEKELHDAGPATYARFSIYPDGGVARLRLFGAPRNWLEGLRRLNALPPWEAQAALIACCGSARWAETVAGKRPFRTAPELFETANRVWAELEPPDRLEAFSRHPQIGEKETAGEQPAQSRRWSEQEQSGAKDASEETQAALEEANRDYRRRFGYIFIVCATGKSSREMLSILKQRLGNDPETELRIAAAEQRRITHLRLGKLLEQ